MEKPIYRADHVGSLLRPDSIRNARKAYNETSSIDATDLRSIEDHEIKNLILMQEAAGLMAVTDGEQRRSFWHYDFMGALSGLEMEEREPDSGVQFAGIKLRPTFPTITDKIDFPENHPHLDHFRFVKDNTKVTPKISIPGPSCCHFRTALEDIRPAQYADTELLTADIAQTYKKAVSAFYTFIVNVVIGPGKCLWRRGMV